MVTASSPRSASTVRLGNEQARVFTPPLRELTPETSLGFEAIAFAEQVLEIGLYPWQKWLLIHALELDEDRHFRFRKVFVLIGRQNGKSTTLQILTLWRMYMDGAPLVLGTAQDRGIARDQWLGAVEIARSVDDLAGEIDGDPVTTRGFEKFALKSGERYEIAASNRKAGRGKSVDLLLMDELREHRNWDAWSAVSKTTNARPDGQVWAVSSAGDLASVVLTHFRKQAHAALGDPDGIVTDPVTGESTLPGLPDDVDDAAGAVGLFEWSAAPGRDVWDREGWAESNPSMGYGALTERTIASDAASDPEHVFRTEVMCQFVKTMDGGPFPAGAWVACLDERVERDASRAFTYGVDVSHDRTVAYVAVAFWDTQGRRRVEVTARRAGTDWLVPWFLSPERRVKPEHVTFQTNGAPVSSLVDEFEAAGIPVTTWGGPDLSRACGMFYDGVRRPLEDDKRVVLTHGVQPALDIAANSAHIKALGDGWVIDRKNSPEDAAPLMAAIGAHWLLMSEPKTFESAYAADDLIVI